MEQDGQVALISDAPRKEFVSTAITIYSSATSARQAEQYGQALIVPLASFFTVEDVTRTLDAVLGNSQISYATGSPDLMLELFRLTPGLIDQSRPIWQGFVDAMTVRNEGKADARYSYPEIRARLGNP